MQVDAIYSQGSLVFARPIKLKHDHVRLVVMVPDEEIDPANTATPAAPTMRERIDAILAPYQHLMTPAPPGRQQSCLA